MKIALRFLATAGLPSWHRPIEHRICSKRCDGHDPRKADGANPKALESSCGEDIKKFCGNVTPGGGRIVYCMQAYEDKISPKCSFELDEVEVDFQAITDQFKDAVRACQGDIAKIVWADSSLGKVVLRHVWRQTERRLRRHVSRLSKNSKVKVM